MTNDETLAAPDVDNINELIGEHPVKLRAWFLAGSVVEPASLAGGIIRGEMLAFDVMKHAYGFSRPLFRAASKVFFRPWNGMTFDPSGEKGTNIFVHHDFLAFACRVGSSVVDEQPALKIMYDEVPNRWPTDGMHDEIRRVTDNILIGCTTRSGKPTIWFGLQG